MRKAGLSLTRLGQERLVATTSPATDCRDSLPSNRPDLVLSGEVRHPYLGCDMANLSSVNDRALIEATRASARPWWHLPVTAVSATALLWALAYLYALITHVI